MISCQWAGFIQLLSASPFGKHIDFRHAIESYWECGLVCGYSCNIPIWTLIFCFLLSKVTRAWMDSPAIRELQHASIVAVETRQRQETPAAPNVACLEHRARGRWQGSYLDRCGWRWLFQSASTIYGSIVWIGQVVFFSGSFPPNIGSAHSTVHIHLVEAANAGLLLGRLQKEISL